MAPAARLLVYCMKQDGEIVVDALNVNIGNPFQNNVSIYFNGSFCFSFMGAH